MYRAVFAFSILALSWGATVVATTGTSEQARAAQIRFEAMDRNGDGIITRDEWQGNARSFQVHDWNGDGRLSGEEVRIGARRNTNWEQVDHVPNRFERVLSWTAAAFTNLDHNRDGRLTSNEWHYDLETFRRVDANRDNAISRAEFLGEGIDDARDVSFDDLDLNNNGRVERGEWYSSAAAFNALDRNRDGVLTRFEVVGGRDTPGDTWDEFANLDFDRNGAIARNEWHWSLGSFTSRDLDRNGVLSRREFEASGGAPGTNPGINPPGSGAGSRTVHVNAQVRWTDAELNVRAGDTLTIDASGKITMSTETDIATPGGSNRTAPDSPILNQSAGGLIARIDNYGPIWIGNKRQIVVPVTGRLFLGVNDDHLADNTGEYVVTVGVQGRTLR
jgi:Ca2+-binding EF-hand superfamily protein